MPRHFALLVVLLVTGCAGTPMPPIATAIPPAVIDHMLASAAAQIRPCYRTPRLPRSARQMSITLRVRLLPDGTVAAPPEPLDLDGGADSYRFAANLLTQAAAQAVTQCAPLRLPAALYRGGWDDFELRFSPGAVA